ncbi:hypothetical protein JQ559_34110 [Bradyrhizobium viridifuturi]|jgi:hypothetical protein|nr:MULTISPECIES: hypothetical protein [unclassified Bradyrhizobium]ERF82182.1 MAG: hypothetical protein C207_04560 [Bradyrhizobium sp. DFCI-1]MBR1024836.1 hypothetical protein [Bradyrhizobium viridifuturi]OYU57641.1 MAG: hypothetical protein CFE30_35100 [Bradyrhizobium sp. PARBB1]PSO18672.1 hypothetical protein C7G43_30740 [Bradyrhizobium sp. MOS004]QRI73679.1 hypothetical protein JQ507_35425 [Bradyrhizobium sp. PSBB068]HAR29656.1 hypothetical protein [Bradyrhizobium sp.]
MSRFPLIGAAALLTIAVCAPASALPLAKMTTAALPEPLVENVHLICDRYGRCYNSRRYVQRRYYVQPGYSSYAYGPGYGYGYGPGISFGFGGGFGHHHHHW